MARTDRFSLRNPVDRSRRLRPILAALLVLGLAGAPGLAAEEHEEESTQSFRRDHNTPHHVEVFVGDTDDRGDHAFTLGAEYEYHFAHEWGTGFLVDHAFGDVRATVAAVPLYWHPIGEWRFVVAPGVELVDLESEETAAGEDDEYFLIRVGAAYEFRINEVFSIAPAFDVDFVDEEDGTEKVYVFGLNFGFKPGRRD